MANSAGKVDQHGVSSGVQVPTKKSDLTSSFFYLCLLEFVISCIQLSLYICFCVVFIVLLYLLYFCMLYLSGCIYCFGIPVPQIIVFLMFECAFF